MTAKPIYLGNDGAYVNVENGAVSVGGSVGTPLVTADADLTQKITVTTAGTPQQGPDKANPGGWVLKPASTNTGVIWWMFHGQTAANKGFPLAVGEPVWVPVLNLSDLDFDAAVSGSIIIASKM